MEEKNGGRYLAIEEVIGCEAKIKLKQEFFAEAKFVLGYCCLFGASLDQSKENLSKGKTQNLGTSWFKF
ncbi:hypothetical protein Ahy_B04g071717 isoform B [Arachis hypogaea]|uniref:Uncharacterized protein n=1 Tax=Arachis hypogaea TaxID=3818 RepID=A0A444ZLG0_ARAHY|nr:hypothetical protein Ahy_B04g071717 isoform B [Arachis hypogaea]